MTDANVVLGHLPPRLLGGEMELDAEAARAAVQTIADAMGLGSAEEAAEGILAIVNENMAGALRLVSVQRGHDPRDFALVAYGGAGPLHANAVAEIMGSFPVARPAGARACSARSATSWRTSATSSRRPTSACSATPTRRRSARSWTALGERAQEWLDDEGIPEDARSIAYTADMRYHRQGYEIPVAIDPGEVTGRARRRSRSASTSSTSSSTGSACPGRRAEIVNLRAIGSGAVPKPELPVGTAGDADASGAVAEEHEIVFKGERARDEDLRPGEARPGQPVRRAGDRDGVRLDDRRPARLRGRGRRELQHPHQPEGVGETMTTITTEKPQVAEIPTGIEIDPVTLDIIEGALKSARYEMDAVLFRSAMSPVIREQHDEFPMITDPRGRMVVGQFGAYINEMMEDWDRGIYPGDVILTSDPFKCSASISHTNDWLVLVPIFYDDELVGWSSQFGHQMDAGGPLPGSLPTGAKTIFEEGIIIPPLKIVERGEVQEDVLRLILNNVRNPEMNRADLFAIVAGCRAGEKRVMELCDRFGKETYLAALQALLDRTYEAMRTLIQLAIPEEPQTFVDYVDDDGLGNGPFKMQLTIWREGDHAFFDWSGTDPQALGPVNFYLSEGMFKMFIGIYLIMVNDPQILFNDGFYPCSTS